FYSEGVHLGETVISTMGTEMSLLDEATNVALISKEKIEEKNYKNVEEILKDNSNVNIVYSKNGPVVDMRGSGDSALSNVKVLVDGVAINPLNTFNKALSINSIPVSTIERIEIAPGGGAVLYGNGVSGGVVNIITKEKAKNSGYVETDFSSYDGKRVSAGGNYNINKDLSFGINYSGQNSKGYRRDEEVKNDFIDGNIAYTISDAHKVKFLASRFVENEIDTDNAKHSVLEEDRRAAGNVYTDSKFVRESYVGKYEFTPNKTVNMFATVYNNKIKNEGVSTDISKTSSNISSQTSKEDTTGMLLKTVVNYDSGSLILGLDTINSEFDGKALSAKGVSTKNDYKKEILSPYILNRYDLTEKLEFTTGYRYEWAKYDLKTETTTESGENKLKDSNEAYEGVLSYKYSDSGNVFFRYERGYMSPTPGQMTDKVEGKLSFNSLEAETSDTFEVGIKDYISDNTFASLSVFKINKDKEISKTKKDNDNITWNNINKTSRDGIELNIENYLGPLTLTEGITYINAVQKGGDSDGDRLEEVPRVKVNLGANYKFTSKIDGTVSYLYIGDKMAQGIKNKSYDTVDLSLRYKPNETLTLKAGVNNVFNEKYNLVEKSDVATPAMERNFFVGAKVVF
ncbi:TonB-dependent receptor, partial [Cetobacterium sp.]|uniref:TonB-dependent receptor n=1 Tax=Cetobacterium sp. TaxID=2071632 RepID=UPI003F2A552C